MTSTAVEPAGSAEIGHVRSVGQHDIVDKRILDFLKRQTDLARCTASAKNPPASSSRVAESQ